MKNYELSPISRPGGKQKNRVKNDRNNFENSSFIIFFEQVFSRSLDKRSENSKILFLSNENQSLIFPGQSIILYCIEVVVHLVPRIRQILCVVVGKVVG